MEARPCTCTEEGGCGLTNVSGHSDQTWLQRERATRELSAVDFVTDMREVEVCVCVRARV